MATELAAPALDTLASQATTFGAGLGPTSIPAASSLASAAPVVSSTPAFNINSAANVLPSLATSLIASQIPLDKLDETRFKKASNATTVAGLGLTAGAMAGFAPLVAAFPFLAPLIPFIPAIVNAFSTGRRVKEAKAKAFNDARQARQDQIDPIFQAFRDERVANQDVSARAMGDFLLANMAQRRAGRPSSVAQSLPLDQALGIRESSPFFNDLANIPAFELPGASVPTGLNQPVVPPPLATSPVESSSNQTSVPLTFTPTNNVPTSEQIFGTANQPFVPPVQPLTGTVDDPFDTKKDIPDEVTAQLGKLASVFPIS